MTERAATESWPNADEELGDFQAELRAVVANLMWVFLYLAGLVTSLPLTSEETSDDDLDDSPAPLLEARTAVLCGMTDHLLPLIANLRLAADFETAEAERTGAEDEEVA